MDIALKLPVQITKQGKQFIAWTPALDLSTSGRSIAEAQRRFHEAVDIFLEELVEAGTIDRVLTDLGWKRLARSWESPKIIKQQTVKVQIPAAA